MRDLSKIERHTVTTRDQREEKQEPEPKQPKPKKPAVTNKPSEETGDADKS